MSAVYEWNILPNFFLRRKKSASFFLEFEYCKDSEQNQMKCDDDFVAILLYGD